MNVRPWIMISLVAATLAGCSQVTVHSDYDRGANFGALRTYAWRPGPQEGTGDPRIDSTLLDNRVRSAINRSLAAKGYQQAGSGTTPDFLVGYHVVLREKTNVQTVNAYYGYRVGGWGGWPQTYVHDYTEGMMLIDVIDPATMTLLWRGTGTRVVDPTASPEKRERRVNDAVDRILGEFPPS